MGAKTLINSRLEKLAVAVAMYPSAEQDTFASDAYIAWDIIKEIRAELEARGYDWRATQKRLGHPRLRKGAVVNYAREP